MSEKLNIALLNDSFPPLIDGVANTVQNYARIINEKHGQACVITPDHPDAQDSAFPYPIYRYPSIDLRKEVGYLAGYPFSPDIARELKKNPPDVLHSHCPVMSTILGRELRTALNVPLIMTYHTKFDIDIAKAVHSKMLQEGACKALALNISGCDEVWVVSHGAGENLRSLGFEGDYVVMPNGVDVPRERLSDSVVAAALADYDLPAGVPVFLFVGRMMWYKGLRLILDALSFVKAMDLDFRMVFVGDGTDAHDVREYALTLGLFDKCIFTGPIRNRDTIRAWYCRSDLFLFPSTYDTNGLVVREAAASSLASVLVKGSCAAEDTSDGQNCFWIDENAASLGACLVKLCMNPGRMKTAGDAAARELYISWDDAVARACERYQVVIDRYKSGGYPPRRSLDELWLKGNGELMDYLGKLEATRLDIEHKLNMQHEQAAEKLQEAYQDFWNKLDRYL